MRAINHALTGAIIGLVVGEPLLAAPAAVVSHFVCDALPHYDGALAQKSKRQWARSRLFRSLLVADAFLCGALVLVLAVTRPSHWLIAAVCAFLAAAPDFLWVGRFVAALRGRAWKPSWFDRFAGQIQWFQRPIGAAVELAWCVAAIIIIWPFIAR